MVAKSLNQFISADGVYADYMLVLANGAEKWGYAEEPAGKHGGKFSFIASKSKCYKAASLGDSVYPGDFVLSSLRGLLFSLNRLNHRVCRLCRRCRDGQFAGTHGRGTAPAPASGSVGFSTAGGSRNVWCR